MATEVSDLNVIQDEDTLRRMWQQTEDFSRKKEIRLRMYRLREERLKSYYITRETTDGGTISGHKPSILTSHADYLSDHNFLTMKTKEIRDSASPVLDLKQSEFRSVCSSNSSNLNQSQQNEGIIVETDIPSHRTNRKARNEPHVFDNNNLSYGKSSSFTTTTSSAKWTNEKSSNYDGYECDSSKGADYKVDHSSKSDYNPRIENSKSGANSKTIEKTSSMEYAESSDPSKRKSDHRTETFSIVESGPQHDSARSIPDHRMQETCNFERGSRNDDVGATSDCTLEKSLDIARNFSSDNSEAGKRTKVEYSRYVDGSEVVKNRINSSENSSRSVNSDTTRTSKNHDTEIYSSICQEKVTDQKTLSNHSTGINYIPKETITRRDDHSKNLQTSATSNARDENTDYFSTRTAQSRIARDDVNVDKNIMNELHKLDSYLSTEAVVGSPTVTSHHYVSDESPILAPTETDYTTTYQKSFSKISQDVSATHNAFASSLRASPPPSKRSSSKSSLERSSPEKTPRISPEKNPSYVGADLSKKLTASFQNRIFNRRETKVSRRRNSTSENDSDDSSATYKKSDVNGRCTEISIRKTKGNNRIQDTEYSSEGSVEREMKKYSKSPNSSPERSAFKTVSSIQAEQFQKEVRRQSFPQIPPSPEKSVKRKLQTEERSHSEKIAVRKSPEKNAKIPSFDCKQTERTGTTRRMKTEKATKGDDVKIKGNEISETAKSKTSPTKTECAEQVPSPAQSRASIEKKYVSPVRSFSPTKSKISPHSFISERNPNSNTPTAESLQTSSTIKNSRIRTETSTPVKTESIPASEITNPSTSRPCSPEKITTTSVKRDLDRAKPTPPDRTSSPTKQDKNSAQSAQTISYDSSKTIASNESDKTFPSSTIRRSRTSPTKTANAKKTKQKNESESDSSESSSSSSSSVSDESDVERNSVTIEEITSDSELNVTRSTLDEQIKSEDEIQSKDEIDDFALIQEEKVTAFDKIKTSEDFLKQEKLIKEGEIDGSIPPPEVVLGKEAAGLYVDGLNKRDQTGKEERKVNADDIGPKKAEKVRPKPIRKPAQEATIISKQYKPLDSDRTLENENLFKKEQLKKRTERFLQLERSQISNDIVKKSKKTHREQREPAKKKAAIKAKPLIDDLKITTKSNKENIDRSAKNPIAQERRKMKTDTNISNKSQNYRNDYWKTNQYAGSKKFSQGVLTPSGMKDINEKDETRTDEYRVATKPNTAAAVAAVAAIGQRKREDIKSKSQTYEAIPDKKTSSKTQFKTSLSKTKLDEKPATKIRKTITIREKPKSPVKKVTDEISNYATPKKTVARTHLKETKTAIGERNSATPSRESKRKDTPKTQQIRINVEGKAEKRKMPKKKPNNAKTEIVGESTSSRGSSFLDLVDIEESERKEDNKDVTKNDGKLSAETRDSQHLNVIVRMPSSSRETTPKILEEQRFCSVSDDGDYPRFADRVIEPDDVEILKKLTIPRFEKITDLDEEEDEEEEEEEKSETVSIADRVSKFLENTKETSTKQTEVDQVFQNQAVCKTKEIFENIAKNSKPSAVIINRSSVFEPKRLRESIKEEEEAEQPQPQSQQQQRNVVSKKLNDKDYEGYEKEANKVTDDEPLKEHGRHKVVSKKLTVSDYEKYVEEKARDGSKQSSTVGRRETEKEQQQPKDTKISNVIDFQETSVRVSESNAKSSSNRLSPVDFESASRTTPTTPTEASSKPKEAGGAVTETSPSSRKTPSPTRRRYAAKETVVEKTTPFEKLSPKPLEITTVEVKPSKRVFDHTAITSVASCDRYTPIKETFDHQLRRTWSNHSSVTINIREDARKSPSPVKERKYKKPSESVEKKFTDEKSRSPSKERGDRKSFSPVKTRQKSPSPEKSTSKLKKKLQSTTTAETKKEFKKRLSSTGSDYQNRIQFFEIKSQKPIKNPKHCESFEKSQTPYVEIERWSPERNAADRSKRKPSPKKDVQVFSTIESRKPALTNVRQKSPDKLIRAEASSFDVTRKKTISKNANDAANEEQSRCEEERKVEEIFDLQLLETMLEKAVKYDIRSRIRAQIRLMKRQMESKNISRTPSPEKVNSSPSRFTNLEAIQTNLDRRDKVKKRLFTEDVKNSGENKAQQRTITEYSSLRRSPSKTTATAARLKSTVPENGLNCAIKNDFRRSKINANETKSATESIISGYGVGPTDKNGKPLFGLKALRTSNEGQLNNEDGFIKRKQNKPNQITDVSGKPLFGLKALQNKEQGKYSDLSEKYQNNDKCGGDQSDVQQSHSTVYSSRTAMRSDGRGNVSILRDEVKGEIHSKAGSEPIGHMTRNQLSYQKPNLENEAGILQTSTTIRNLTSKEMSDYTTGSSSSTDAYRISNYSTDNTSPDDVNWNSKFSSSSLIRKISNEHFEKAQRRFSGSGDDSTAKRDSREKTDLKYKLFSKTESSDSDKTLPSGDKCNYENITQTGRNNSFKEIKSKFQQATVSSSMKQVFRNDDKVSKNENEYSRILQRENTGDSLRSHPDIFEDESKISSSNTFVTASEMRTYSRSSTTSDVRQITGTKSKFENEEKESALRFEKFTGGCPVSLHELERLSTGDRLNSKSVTPVRKLEKAQNKTKIKELDIDQIFDEEKLRNLLEACTDYENRRLIRARLRAIMANRKGCKDLKSATDNADKTNESTEINQITKVATTKNENFSSCTKVQSKTSTSRIVKANSVTSPFAKFRQLDRQNSCPSSGTPIFKFTDPKLARSASSIKDRLLNWVKAQTKEYENIQIDNFSTSWNNGLAFCALIHHFCPHAFDYNKLTPEQRRHNFELAFRVAEEEAGIVPLLDVEDMVVMKRPDWKCVFTYVQSVYQRFHASPEAVRP